MARKFDAIVIGSGLGGLTAAAICARAGMRMLVLERNQVFGGASTIYRHNGLTIESSLHEIDGFDEDDPKLPLIRSLGLDRDIELADVGDLYEVRGLAVGEPFVMPHGLRAALAATTARFPHREAAFEEYFQRITTLRGAVSFAARHHDDRNWWVTHAPEAIRRLWPILRDGRATVGEAMNDLFGDDEAVKLALAANLNYFHDDPEQMLFLSFAVAQASYLLGGGHYVRGGSQALTNRLVALIEAAGGTLESGREAHQFVIEGGRIAGVSHRARDGSDPRSESAPAAFGNAAPNVLAGMLPEDKRAPFMASYRMRRQSISLWTLSLGLGRPPREFGVKRFSTFVLPPWMTSLTQMREAAAIIGEQPLGRIPPYVFVDYGQIESGLNESAPFLVTLCGTDRIENWSSLEGNAKRNQKLRWIDALISDIDGQYPGIASVVVHQEMATAETMQHYLNTPGGSVYGFAPVDSLGQAIKRGPHTTIEGLWLASAFTVSGGYTGAMIGGAQAAYSAMRELCSQPS